MLRVMIVDDEPIVREGLNKVIPWNELGAEIIFLAQNGQEAWDFIQENQVDVVLSDIKMPIMDGLELAKNIWSANNNTVMILISAYADFEYAQKAIRYNVKEYLTKPIDLENIRHIKRVITDLAIDKEIRLLSQNKDNFEYLMQANDAIIKRDEKRLKELLGTELNINIDQLTRAQDYYVASINCFYAIESIKKLEYMSVDVVSEQIRKLQSVDEIKKYVEKIIHTGFRLATIEKKRSEQICDIVEQIIKDKYSNLELNVGMIADELGLDAQYVGALYKKNKEVSIVSEIKEYRLKKSMELLTNTNFDVKSISEQVGFNNYRYFTTKFKEYTGMSPTDFRKNKERGSIK